MAESFDVVVVGAGPAGSAAALVLARAGHSVCLLERGPFPGAKNLYGGVVYAKVLDSLCPGWQEEAPLERWVTRRVTMMLTDRRSLALDFRSQVWGEHPYNGATALRPRFDAWLAEKAVTAGASLVTATTATGLRWEGRRIAGVTTDRPEGDISAGVVIACDGVNAFLAKEAGLAPQADPSHYTLGVKEVLALPAGEIEKRFGLAAGEGADFEVLGATGEVAGGGFLYTNSESLAIGLVLSVSQLRTSKRRPEELLADFKAHPSIEPLVRGGELIEYGAHLIPEAGLAMQPELSGDGMLVAGDAAGLCLAAGLWLEGVNFAVASGAAAGEAAAEALAHSDTSRAGLAGYRHRLESTFVLADHKRLRRAPELLMSERMQRRYPELLCGLVEELFTVNNPVPKPGLLSLARRHTRSSRLGVGQLVGDAWRLWRTFG